MKFALLQLVVLLAIAGLLMAAGYNFAANRWGPAGSASMWVAGAICLLAALLAALAPALVGRLWPGYMPQAVLAGTAIRLLTTMGLGLAYQALGQVHRDSFLAWLLALYLALLAAETAFGVALVRRTGTSAASGKG